MTSHPLSEQRVCMFYFFELEPGNVLKRWKYIDEHFQTTEDKTPSSSIKKSFKQLKYCQHHHYHHHRHHKHHNHHHQNPHHHRHYNQYRIRLTGLLEESNSTNVAWQPQNYHRLHHHHHHHYHHLNDPPPQTGCCTRERTRKASRQLRSLGALRSLSRMLVWV